MIGVVAAAVLAMLSVGSWRQARYWRSDQALWEHAVACDPTNVTALRNLGMALEQNKNDQAAAAQYRRVLEMGENEQRIYRTIWINAHNGLGNIANRKGDVAGSPPLLRI